MRYAVYFIPEPQSALWAFGSSVIGYDSFTGSDVPYPNHDIFRDPDARAWSEAPRKYGFHATLKAPFALRGEAGTEADLLGHAEDVAKASSPVSAGNLQVATLGPFLALTLPRTCPSLDRLAATCVREFEPFRAPLSPPDRARRLNDGLSDAQIANLDQWGYPHVFDQFRFHMTLTGPIADIALRERLGDALRQVFAETAEPLTIDAIAVCRQLSRDQRFRVVQRFPLGRAAN